MDSTKERIRGTVIWFTGTFGFICPDGRKEGEADVFLHFSQITMSEEGAYKTLEPKSRVEFSLGVNHRGPMAVEVVKIEDAKK